MANRYMEYFSEALLPVDKTHDGLGPGGEHAHSVENPWGLHFHADGTLGGAHLHIPDNPMGLHGHGVSPLRGGGHLHGHEAAISHLNPDGSHGHVTDDDTMNKVTDKSTPIPVVTDQDRSPLAKLILDK